MIDVEHMEEKVSAFLQTAPRDTIGYFKALTVLADKTAGLMDVDMSIIEEVSARDHNLDIDQYLQWLEGFKHDKETAARDAVNGAFNNKSQEKPQRPGIDVFNPFEPFEKEPIKDLPSFPVECLPDALAVYVNAVAESVAVPVDMPACMGLACVALCCQGVFQIEVKPDWIEPVNLYLTQVMRPSERKSPSLNFMLKPLRDFMNEYNEKMSDEIDASQARISVLNKQVAAMEKALARPSRGKLQEDDEVINPFDGGDPDIQNLTLPEPSKGITFNDLNEKRRELRKAEENAVTELRLLMDDVTSESFAEELQKNGERMGIISAEGGLFGVLAGAYSKTQQANIDIFLKAYSGESYACNRVTRSAVNLNNPLLTMSLAVQPVVLEQIMENDEFKGRGLLARFLYSIPVSRVGTRTFRTQPIGDRDKEYRKLLERLLLFRASLDEVVTFTLSEDAGNTVECFYDYVVEPGLVGEMEDIEEWGGKFTGQVMRIAALLHIIGCDNPVKDTVISNECVNNAILIGGYFQKHAKAAFDIMGVMDMPNVRDAKYIFKRLFKYLNDLNDFSVSVSMSKVIQLCRGKLRDAEGMAPGLEELLRRGYIRIFEPLPDARQKGRPPKQAYVNPEAIENYKRTKTS